MGRILMFNLKTLSYTSVCSALILSSLSAPVYAAPGDTFIFTNCSATGRIGPLQAACDAAYAATTLNGLVTVTAGIQAWVVPDTDTYSIQALGAAGGTQTFGGANSAGGLGASIQGDVNLTAGETIFFIVGQMGEDTRVNTQDNAAPGGGGGSFVYRLATDATPLIAAGGGGSGTSCDPLAIPSDQDASATNNGNAASDETNGGIAGNGGTSNDVGSSYFAGGGAGWLTDGTGGGEPPVDNVFSVANPARHAEGGRTPQNGALGGTRSNDNTDEGGDGGFGGGGGGGSDNMGGGGGGGFSGGGGADGDDGSLDDGCNNLPGGGGGSFNSGANPVNAAAANATQGAIVVTQGATGAQSIPTTSFWGLSLLTALLGLFGFSKRRRN